MLQTLAQRLATIGAATSFFKMTRNAPRTKLERWFDVTLVAKAADGVLEIAGSALLYGVRHDRISGLLRAATQHELIHGHHDVLIHLLNHAAGHVTAESQSFAALFLLWHGLVKVLLVWALLRRLLWAYPVGLAAFGLFLVYQVYRYVHTGSAWLLALSVLDLLVIGLTAAEYRRLLAARPGGGT